MGSEEEKGRKPDCVEEKYRLKAREDRWGTRGKTTVTKRNRRQ